MRHCQTPPLAEVSPRPRCIAALREKPALAGPPTWQRRRDYGDWVAWCVRRTGQGKLALPRIGRFAPPSKFVTVFPEGGGTVNSALVIPLKEA